MGTEIKRPVLRYHGGKFLLAPWVISHFPPHRNYTESFGGAGSVLLQKPRSRCEVYNDKWDVVVNVFRVLRDPELALRLQNALSLTPYARSEFYDTYKDEDLTIDPVERARQTILRSFAGFGSSSTCRSHLTGFRANNRSNGTNCAWDWMNYPSNIPAFVQRLRGVVIENKNYKEILQQQDSPDTLHFLDPPYVQSTRNMKRGNANYAHEFTDQDHIEMAEEVTPLRGMVIVAGYDCPLYQDLYKGWAQSKIKSLADGARPRIECLWINAAAAAKLNKKLF